MDNLNDYNRNSGPTESEAFAKVRPLLIGAMFLGMAFVFFLLQGCYANPLAERKIKADKINFTISSPWTTTTIQAEGWESDVKTQPVERQQFPAPAESKQP